MAILCGGALLAAILAGCGSSPEQPTPQATIAAMKAEDAKHARDMQAAQQQHDAQAAASQSSRNSRSSTMQRR